jgi:hypothetical protein
MTKELGVGSLVEGSVRVEGERVRITVELIDAPTQQTLWSQQYERDLANVFAVQSDVALRIADALRASLTPQERSRVEQQPTSDPEAYRLYLESRQHTMGARAANLAGMELLRRALALDPSFALAWDNPTLAAAHFTLARAIRARDAMPTRRCRFSAGWS